jgi:hypothetical protein
MDEPQLRVLAMQLAIAHANNEPIDDVIYLAHEILKFLTDKE